MKEVEVKILDVNPAEIRKLLEKAGASAVFENTQITARIYDFPDRRIKKKGSLVRLRKTGKKAELTFKELESKKGAKICDETDVEVGSFELADKFLKSLGMKCFAEYKKTRSRYRKGKWQYEIDKYPGIPHFVEVEVKSSDARKAKKELENAVRLLGYEMKDAKPWNSFDVHMHYKKQM